MNQIIWDKAGQPFSQQFDDVYFSRHGGIDESRYIFIEHNNLPQRWATLPAQGHFIIGETGFGTGLNFLATWDSWRRTAPPGVHLHFVSTEKYPLSRAQLQRALQLWPQLAHLAEPLIAAWPPMPAQGFQRLVFDEGRVILTLILDDALTGLRQLLPIAAPGPNVQAQQPTWAGTPMVFDALFLDGFAPAKNPEMWNQPLFDTLARLSKPETTFATFSTAAVVREGLTQAGFQVNTVPGFDRKRHMLRGRFSLAEGAPKAGVDSAWHLMSLEEAPPPGRFGAGFPKTRREPVPGGSIARIPRATALENPAPNRPSVPILIIGAGLAGCHSARALAERGYSVTLLEKNTIASGASGNPQGVVYAKASSRDQPLTNFNLTALQFACRYYQTRVGYRTCGAASGVVHLAQTAKQADEYQALAARYQQEPDFVRWLSQEQTEAECGLPLTSGGLLFPQAGWLNPPQLCRELLNHPNIHCKEQHPVARIAYTQGQWQAFGADGTLLAQAPQLVIASANDALRLAQTAHLPIKPIRGQMTEVAATNTSKQLTRVLCGKGYIAPARQGIHCLGASYNLGDMRETPHSGDNRQNLAQIAGLSPALSGWTQVNSGRVSFRCTTPDYLPLVGAAPIAGEFLQRFDGLRRNAKTVIDATGSYYPGLFINIGHGSRGLAYTPLCAELLASLITATPLPLSRDMALRLHPARFLIRGLKRNRDLN